MTARDISPLVVVRVGPALAARLVVDRAASDEVAAAFDDREGVVLQLDDAPGEHFDGTVAAAALLGRLANAWFAIATGSLEGAGHPYNLARRILSLEQLSHGRIAWVHDLDPAATADADFVTVVQQLWRSWPRESLATTTDAPHFADVANIRRIGAAGTYRVAGPLNVPSSPQQVPVVVARAVPADAHRYVDLIARDAQWQTPDAASPVARVVSAAVLADLVEIGGSLPRATRGPQTLRERLALSVPALVELDGASDRFAPDSEAEAS